MANNKCKECGCVCNKCAVNHDVHLHVEIENLKQRLVERDNHIVTMETTFLNEANKYPNGEFVALREELLTWQDKYSRLYEAHKRVQKVNQSLEDKLLKLVDKTETEKTALTKDVATLSHRLADANYTIQRLQEDNEKYKNDVNLAIQLLQCKPGNFVSHRIDSLPNEVQAKVSSYVASRRKPPEERKPPEVRSIKVPIPTFPPTAMVYSVPKTPSPEKDTNKSSELDKPQVDLVSAAIMAKILEEREKERSFTKHCDSCTCSKLITPTIVHSTTHHTVATQTQQQPNQKNSLCLRCNGDLERSPLGSMKIIKTTSTSSNTIINNNNNNNNSNNANCNNNNTNASNNNNNNYTTTTATAVAAAPAANAINSSSGDCVPNYQNTTSSNSNSHHLLSVVSENNTKTYPQNALYTEVDERNGKLAKSKIAVSENSKISINTFTDSFVKSAQSTKNSLESKTGHHRLCDQNATTTWSGSENVKGPRYCSMRLQTGSKNILLDNVHGNYAPVLYTRQESSERDKKQHHQQKQLKENSNQSINGSNCCDVGNTTAASQNSSSNNTNSNNKTINVHVAHSKTNFINNTNNTNNNNNNNDNNNCSRTGSSLSSEERKSLSLSSECDNTYQKQQRVAEWVQNIDDNETSASSSDYSSSRNEIHPKRMSDFDAQHYAQIETNVKNFLFKNDARHGLPPTMMTPTPTTTTKSTLLDYDSKSIKKFSNMKQKYNNSLPSQTDDTSIDSNKNTPTETEI